jgi:hypothetical protein
MNCERFEAKLDELVDQRLPADSDASLMNHVERCPRCARLLADYETIVDAMNQVQLPDSNELGARVLAELAAPAASPAHAVELPQRNSPRVFVRAAAWTLATVAAVLLIAVVITHGNNTAKPDGSNSLTVKSVDPRPHSPNDRLVAISVEEFHTVADLIDAQHRNLEQVSDRLRPVTRSMSAAFQALRHSSQPRSDLPARSS